MLCTHALCKKAAEHVYLVRACCRDEKLGAVGACVRQSFKMRAGGAYAHDIVVCADTVYDLTVGVNNNDLMSLAYKALQNALANFTAADYNDFHKSRLV